MKILLCYTHCPVSEIKAKVIFLTSLIVQNRSIEARKRFDVIIENQRIIDTECPYLDLLLGRGHKRHFIDRNFIVSE